MCTQFAIERVANTHVNNCCDLTAPLQNMHHHGMWLLLNGICSMWRMDPWKQLTVAWMFMHF